jgi:hypothetical protein
VTDQRDARPVVLPQHFPSQQLKSLVGVNGILVDSLGQGVQQLRFLRSQSGIFSGTLRQHPDRLGFDADGLSGIVWQP